MASTRREEEIKILSMVDEKRDEIIETMKTFVKIPSRTGEEGEAQKAQAGILEEMGLEVDVWEPDVKELLEKYPDIAQYPSRWEPELDLVLQFPDKCTFEQLVSSGYIEKLNYKNRPNVVSTLRGIGGGRSLILNGHMDTATVEPIDLWTHDPFGAEIEEGKMYGRGTSDMKSGVVAMTKAVDCIIKSGIELRGDIILESVVNEEHAGNGTLACVARGYKADAAIVTEPTDLNTFSISGSGAVYWRIIAKGKAFSPMSRWTGPEGDIHAISAIEKTPFIINGLLNLERNSNKESIQFKLGLGIIKGGVQATSTAGECAIDGVVYFAPKFGTGNSGINKVKELLKGSIAKASNEDAWLRSNPAELYFTHYDDAFEINSNEEIVQTLIEAGKKVLGKAPQIKPMGGDARHLINQSGIPTIVYGPGNIASIHGIDEYIDIEDLITGTKVIASAIYRWCK
jgi:acetylornithine deacetylase